MTFPYVIECEKRPATGSRGMVVTNNPLASGAGAQVLLAGGNAVDAAVAALFALTVAEPMMVGILGGGLTHLRRADGTHLVIDNLSTAPAAARADMYRPVSAAAADRQLTEGRENNRGPRAVATPGALAGWAHTLARFGTWELADILAPAIAIAERGFDATPYLCTCVADTADDLRRDPGLAAMLLPGGAPLPPGTRVRRPDYAHTLRTIATDGPGALYGGPLGDALAAVPGILVTADDLRAYRPVERDPIRTSYRGWDVLAPPPPSSAGVHIAQMLNTLEPFDLGASGFGTPATIHLLAEAMKIAYADRAAVTGDPDFVEVPVDRLVSKAYAATRPIDPGRARDWQAGVPPARPATPRTLESADTTHLTVADAQGNVVAATQTINGLFGACVSVPGTGMICNNYMLNFDPHPGTALSVAPNKRVFTSMAPTMAVHDGRLRFAVGLPGALRIFPSAMQVVLNIIDHRMTLQEAVEAPRVWTQGGHLELETALTNGTDGAARMAALAALGHQLTPVGRVAGGTNGIALAADGTLTGAACWRADGTPVGIAGGLARPGVRFVI